MAVAEGRAENYGNQAYWGMFPDHVPEVIDKLVQEETRELKAAA
jgi:hypothetical protein